uniref:WG repeat-containing protein n=1 Tax=Paenibacillus polymyxa TaxID=1406 RepID=A0AAE9PU13_PAEPO
MQQYYFDDQGRFVIENYAQAKPFSSFLPGIAGVQGIPLWAYYVNRGQGIASFGVEDKNGAIMEFFRPTAAIVSCRYMAFERF